MSEIKQTITYYSKPGSENTQSVLELARERYDAGDIKKIILASTYGDTALSAADLFKSSGAHLIIFGEVLEGKQHPTADVCEKLRSQGHQIIWGVHLNAISQFTQDHSARLVSEAYYRISEGFKVACEITLIAASQGFIGHAEKILSIAGTHRGADTAIVAMAAPITKFNEFEVLEILCKPYSRTKVG